MLNCRSIAGVLWEHRRSTVYEFNAVRSSVLSGMLYSVHIYFVNFIADVDKCAQLHMHSVGFIAEWCVKFSLQARGLYTMCTMCNVQY